VFDQLGKAQTFCPEPPLQGSRLQAQHPRDIAESDWADLKHRGNRGAHLLDHRQLGRGCHADQVVLDKGLQGRIVRRDRSAQLRLVEHHPVEGGAEVRHLFEVPPVQRLAALGRVPEVDRARCHGPGGQQRCHPHQVGDRVFGGLPHRRQVGQQEPHRHCLAARRSGAQLEGKARGVEMHVADHDDQPAAQRICRLDRQRERTKDREILHLRQLHAQIGNAQFRRSLLQRGEHLTIGNLAVGIVKPGMVDPDTGQNRNRISAVTAQQTAKSRHSPGPNRIQHGAQTYWQCR